MKENYKALYLSPHLDDAVLSCGGLIRKQTMAGERVLVVTVFAGTPSYEGLSLFARLLHLTWGNPHDPVGRRCREDEAALRYLGADFLHLHFLDALYRQTSHALYTSNRALFGTVHPKDRGLQEEAKGFVEEIVARFGNPLLYAPLSVGHHVDHQITRWVAEEAGREGRGLVYYEDFPYVEDKDALREALGQSGGWSSTIEEVAQTIEDKIEALSLYTSQIFGLFRSRKGMERRVKRYADSLAPGRGPGERYWKRIQPML